MTSYKMINAENVSLKYYLMIKILIYKIIFTVSTKAKYNSQKCCFKNYWFKNY